MIKFLLGIFFCFSTAFGQKNQSPNILFIAVDDLKPTIKSFGDEIAITPNLDFLSRSSTIFLNNHTQQAICSPSRISLLTGMRPDYTQVYDLKTKMRDKRANILTLPQHFKNNGYTTAGIGKIFDPRGVDSDMDEPSWSIPFLRAYKIPYPKEYGQPKLGFYQNPEIKTKIDKIIVENNLKRGKVGKFFNNKYKPPISNSNAPDEAYADGAIAQEAIRLIDRLSSSKNPFFLAVGFKRPHLPFSAPKKYFNLYNPKKIPLEPFRQRAKNVGDLAYHNSGELQSYAEDGREYTLDANQQLQLDKDFERELIHGYYACVTFIDFQIGKILNQLKQKGLMDNTIIVIWGDHGYHFGDHRLWNKHSNFEQATRSPLLIYDPSSKKGNKIISPTEFVDVFPTLNEIANIPKVDHLEGESLLPLMTNRSQIIKPYAVSQYPRKNAMGYSFRSSSYRYTVWIDKKNIGKNISENQVLQEELFDYKDDPLETKNHIGSKDHEQIYIKMKSDAFHFLNYSDFPPSTQIDFDSSIKDIVKANYNTDKVFIGATLNHVQLGTAVSDLFLKEFTYSTPENCAKQARIHPRPGVWDWQRLDEYLDFADQNNITLRIHGPVSPQVSKWAKEDHRTPEELEKNMIDYFTALCKKINTEPSVKWMDVVNETITPEGNWFREKPGTDKWENPWEQIGRDENDVPLYITKAFEIANRYATNVSQVFNQHGGMEPKMWEKVKQTILYLKSEGYRIDGLGWQAHLRSDMNLAMDEKQLKYLSSLIDWAHDNDLDFHVTEIDYKIMSNSKNSKSFLDQAAAYANILKVLLEKSNNGVVTFNTWGMVDGKKGKHHDKDRFIFDRNLQPKPAYYGIKDALLNKSNDLKYN